MELRDPAGFASTMNAAYGLREPDLASWWLTAFLFGLAGQPRSPSPATVLL